MKSGLDNIYDKILLRLIFVYGAIQILQVLFGGETGCVGFYCEGGRKWLCISTSEF